MALFTRENAREMSIRGNQARWRRKQAPVPIPKPDPSATLPEQLTYALSRAIDDLVQARNPKDVALRTKALAEIREAYAVVTGKRASSGSKPLEQAPAASSRTAANNSNTWSAEQAPKRPAAIPPPAAAAEPPPPKPIEQDNASDDPEPYPSEPIE